MVNETMGWVELGSSGSLCLRLWQRFRNDGENDASNYHQVWLEASTSGSSGSFTPLDADWSYTNKDILIEIYHDNVKVTQLPLKLKTLLTITHSSITIANNEVKPWIFNPYANNLFLEFDFHQLCALARVQQGYGLKIDYRLSETVIAGGNRTNGNFFVIEDISGDVGTHTPTVDQNLLLNSLHILPFYISGQMLKWEGFTHTIQEENASQIWKFPNEVKNNNVFASPASVVKEGKYKITLGCTDRFNTNQKQTIQFVTEVDYDLE